MPRRTRSDGAAAGRPRSVRAARVASGLVVAVGLALASGDGPAAATAATSATPATSPLDALAPPAASGSWTVYHGDPADTGVSSGLGPIDTTAPAWTSPSLDGQLYGEPLVEAGRVYVATENDTVYALSATTGRVVWSTHVAHPVPASSLPCGDISPTVGITGTPVIDPSRNEIFVVADELAERRSAHLLVGLDTATGEIELTEHVDPPGADPAALLQRTGLNLDAGRVIFGMRRQLRRLRHLPRAGRAVPESGGTSRRLYRRRRPRRRPGSHLDGRRRPCRRRGRQYLGERRKRFGHLASHDLRRQRLRARAVLLAASAAVLRPVELGQRQCQRPRHVDGTGAAHRRTGRHHREVPASPTSSTAPTWVASEANRRPHLGCGNDIDGGSARGRHDHLRPLPERPDRRAGRLLTADPAIWSASVGGGPPSWPPAWSGPSVRTASSTGWTSHGPSQPTGPFGVPANHFPTPGIGDGLLLAPASDQVVAFTDGSTTTTTTTLRPPSTTAPAGVGTGTHHGVAAETSGGLPAGALAAIAVGGAAILGLLAWLIRRRRRVSPPPP